MAITLRTDEEIHFYLRQLTEKARLPRYEVNEIILPLIGLVFTLKDDGRPIRVLKYAAWVWFGGSCFFFSYDHERHCIQVRERSNKGRIILRFNNNVDTDTLEDCLSVLADGRAFGTPLELLGQTPRSHALTQ